MRRVPKSQFENHVKKSNYVQKVSSFFLEYGRLNFSIIYDYLYMDTGGIFSSEQKLKQ